MNVTELRRIQPRIALAVANILLLVAATVVLLFPSSPDGERDDGAGASPLGTLPSVAGLPPSAVPVQRGQLIANECKADPGVTTPYNAGASGTPMTSCGFVERTRRAIVAQGMKLGMYPLQVFSPATGKVYKLACFATNEYATCTGGAGAIIYLYNDK